jgi:hypothetical protein
LSAVEVHLAGALAPALAGIDTFRLAWGRK